MHHASHDALYGAGVALHLWCCWASSLLKWSTSAQIPTTDWMEICTVAVTRRLKNMLVCVCVCVWHNEQSEVDYMATLASSLVCSRSLSLTGSSSHPHSC